MSLLAVIAASDPTILMNFGVPTPSSSSCRRTLVNPQYPASVNHYFPTSHVVYTCVLAALGKLNPPRAVAPAGFGTGAIAIGYSKGRAGKPTVQYELMVTSLGGTSTHDGTSIVLPMNHFTPGTPVEIVETEYPVMVRRFDIWRDSAGAGRQRGGIGHVREYQLSSMHLDRAPQPSARRSACTAASGPRLAHGDQSGHAAGRGDGLHGTRLVPAGTVLRLEQTGGGGYGEPAERPDELAGRYRVRHVAGGRGRAYKRGNLSRPTFCRRERPTLPVTLRRSRTQVTQPA